MKALILSDNNFEDSELLVPLYRLQEAGYGVEVAAGEQGSISGKHGYEVRVDKTFAEVDPADYAVLILPEARRLRQSATKRRSRRLPGPFLAPANRWGPSVMGRRSWFQPDSSTAAGPPVTVPLPMNFGPPARNTRTARWWWTAGWSLHGSRPTCRRSCASWCGCCRSNRKRPCPVAAPDGATMLYRLLADLVVLAHALFVLFVVCGGLAVLRRPRLAWLHLPAATWGAVVEFKGWICPLTYVKTIFAGWGAKGATICPSSSITWSRSSTRRG